MRGEGCGDTGVRGCEIGVFGVTGPGDDTYPPPEPPLGSGTYCAPGEFAECDRTPTGLGAKLLPGARADAALLGSIDSGGTGNPASGLSANGDTLPSSPPPASDPADTPNRLVRSGYACLSRSFSFFRDFEPGSGPPAIQTGERAKGSSPTTMPIL